MIRNLKTLSLATGALLAVSATMASAASAQQGVLTSDGPVTLTGTEDPEGLNALTAIDGKVECPGSTYTGHKVDATPHELLNSGETEGTITPHLRQENCVSIDAGGTERPVTVHMNGCDIVLETSEKIAENEYSGTGSLQCPEGAALEVTVFAAGNESHSAFARVCTFKGEPQGSTGSATLVNTAEGTIEASGAITGISGSQSGLCGSKSTEEAQIHFAAEVTGHNAEGKPTGISVSD